MSLNGFNKPADLTFRTLSCKSKIIIDDKCKLKMDDAQFKILRVKKQTDLIGNVMVDGNLTVTGTITSGGGGNDLPQFSEESYPFLIDGNPGGTLTWQIISIGDARMIQCIFTLNQGAPTLGSITATCPAVANLYPLQNHFFGLSFDVQSLTISVDGNGIVTGTLYGSGFPASDITIGTFAWNTFVN